MDGNEFKRTENIVTPDLYLPTNAWIACKVITAVSEDIRKLNELAGNTIVKLQNYKDSLAEIPENETKLKLANMYINEIQTFINRGIKSLSSVELLDLKITINGAKDLMSVLTPPKIATFIETDRGEIAKIGNEEVNLDELHSLTVYVESDLDPDVDYR